MRIKRAYSQLIIDTPKNIHSVERTRRTFHLKHDPSLPIFTWYTQNKPDDRSGGAEPAVSFSGTVSAPLVTSPSGANQLPPLKGAVQRENADKGADGRDGIQVRWRKVGGRISYCITEGFDVTEVGGGRV